MRIEFDVPEGIFRQLLGSVTIPRMAKVRFAQPTPEALPDLRQVVAARMEKRARSSINAGDRIAIGVGSRGINRLPEIVGAVVSELRAMGAHPFIVPAMGSHGGATADGQRQVLAHLGVTEESVAAPIESQMDTDVIGRTEGGTEVRMDRSALGADGIVLIARVKPHTAFHGTYESGMSKMLAIGLGKQAGAANTHAAGFGEMARIVPAMASIALQRAPVRFAVAVLENARDEVCELQVVPANRILIEEPELLERARNAMPQIPYQELDVLLIDEIGKNISGDGADPNVTGRFPTPFATGGPSVNKQVVLALTDAARGNANGIGTADFTTIRLARKMSLADTYPNALTSTVAGPVKLPMVLPSDRFALSAALLTCNAVGRPPRMIRIKNTLRLDTFWISESLLDEVRGDPRQELLEGPMEMEFDAEGNLPGL
ncbi:MAG: lactate racemase domain-containing protein [Chloroflexota bacterium]